MKFADSVMYVPALEATGHFPTDVYPGLYAGALPPRWS